jgi:hypothetical protein
MKRNYILLLFLLATVSILAQTPEKMSYQVVLRDASNTLLTNQQVGMQISILQTTITGTAVYIETQIATTNINGLVSIAIGSGTSSNNFSAIDWSAGPYFIKTETDPSGGSSYTITGTTQLMSVPFALYAKTSGSSTPGPQGADGQGGVTAAGTGINVIGAGTVGSPYVVSTTSPCGLAIGQSYQGGIIFYLGASGCHGLIAAPSDQSTSAAWWNGSYMDTSAHGSGLFEGKYNTKIISRKQGGTTSAAAICTNYGDYKWYLPSIEELNLMYENIGQGNALGLGNIGDFDDGLYWSSTEYNNYLVWFQYFDNGSQNITRKDGTSNVRAARAF